MTPTILVLVGFDDDMLEVVRRVCREPGMLVAHAIDHVAGMQYLRRHAASAVIAPSETDPAWVAQARRVAPDALLIVIGSSHAAALLAAGADAAIRCFDESRLGALLGEICANSALPIARRMSIVIIESEPQLATVLERWLRRAFDVVRASSAGSALELIRASPPDLVLTELRLPDLEPDDLHAAIAAIRPTLADRTLFMTAGFVPDRAQQFLARVPGQWIHKPLDLVRLRAALEALAR